MNLIYYPDGSVGFLFPEPVRREIEARRRRLFLKSEDKTVKFIEELEELEEMEPEEMVREEKEMSENEKIDMEEKGISLNVEIQDLWYSVECIIKMVRLYYILFEFSRLTYILSKTINHPCNLYYTCCSICLGSPILRGQIVQEHACIPAKRPLQPGNFNTLRRHKLSFNGCD